MCRRDGFLQLTLSHKMNAYMDAFRDEFWQHYDWHSEDVKESYADKDLLGIQLVLVRHEEICSEGGQCNLRRDGT